MKQHQNPDWIKGAQKAFRKWRGDRSQCEMAALLGTHQCTVSAWEVGRNIPSDDLMAAIERLSGGAVTREMWLRDRRTVPARKPA